MGIKVNVSWTYTETETISLSEIYNAISKANTSESISISDSYSSILTSKIISKPTIRYAKPKANTSFESPKANAVNFSDKGISVKE